MNSLSPRERAKVREALKGRHADAACNRIGSCRAGSKRGAPSVILKPCRVD